MADSRDIKTIPTFYNGIQFRSRLEARWAFFFDLCKIKWNYELEGYEFNGKKYLPDFYLPESEIYVEVKPNLSFVKEPYVFNKVIDFMKSSPKKMLVFVDTPVKAKYYSFEGFISIQTGEATLDELHLVWLMDKETYKPFYYPIIRTIPDEFFVEASNRKFY